MYILNGTCPSLATVNLNKVWALAYSPIAGLIFGRMCLLKYHCWSSVTSLPESNKDGILIPWVLIHTLGHLATKCSLHYLHFCFYKNGGIDKSSFFHCIPHSQYENHSFSLLWFGLWPREDLVFWLFWWPIHIVLFRLSVSWASLLFNFT